MATRDDGVVLVSPRDGMALGLGLAATTAAADLIRLGGYRPTDAEWRALSEALSKAVVAMVASVADWAAATDDQLEAAAQDMAARLVRLMLGPPPAPAPVN